MEKLCSIEGCERPQRGPHGLCNMHRLRQERSGSVRGAAPELKPRVVTHEGLSCAGCGDIKAREDFPRRTKSRTGFDAYCRACHSVRNRERYEQNKEKVKARTSAYYWRNREAISEASKQRYAENRESVLERVGRYQRENRDKVTANYRRWAAANPERARAIRRASVTAWRARRREQFVERVDFDVVWKRDGGLCGICGDPADPTDWHLDHVVPLSCGGEHSYANTQVAHPFCNMSKGAKLPEEMNVNACRTSARSAGNIPETGQQR